MHDDLDTPTEAELQDAVSERLVAISGPLPPALREDPVDLVAGLTKFMVNLAGGGLFGDFFIGKFFPRTTDQRAREYLAATARRVEAQNRRLRRVERRLDDLGGQHVALLQEGFESAARATSDERITLIGAIVGDGLSGDELEAEFERSHIRLLNALTDRDVETLQIIAHPSQRPPRVLLGPDDIVRQEEYRRAITVMSDAHLLSLGLIDQPTSIEPRRSLGSAPLTPRLRQHSKAITPLGRSLLQRLEEAAAPVPGPKGVEQVA